MADDKKVDFTDEQQEVVNELIRRKQGEAAAQVRAELATAQGKMTDMESKLASLTADLEVAKLEKPGKTNAEYEAKLAQMKQATSDELKNLRDKANEASKNEALAKQQVIDTRKQVAMRDAAGAAKFVNASQAIKLAGENVKFDEAKGRFVVVDDYGTERMNSQFDPMTLEQYFAEFAGKNKHLVLSDARSGTGATETTQQTKEGGEVKLTDLFGKGSSSILANQLALRDKAEYNRLRAKAVAQGLI